MKPSRFVLPVVAIAIASPSVIAGIVTSDPGLYENTSSIFESRVRLDGGNSQTWKTGFWQGSSFIQQSPNQSNVFADGATYGFTLSYDAGSSAASINITGANGLNITDSFMVDAGEFFSGFRLYARSNNDGSTTTVNNIMASVDGAPAVGLADVVSGGAQSFVEENFYFDAATTSLSLTGNFSFDWVDGSNLNNERFKFGVYFLQGTPVPTPGAAGVLSLAGIAALRRRR